MLTGNLLALSQTNVKRILAFSSIAHMGYLLVALLAGGALGAPAATYYLIAYAATILGAFGLMTVLSGPRLEAASVDDYRGLFWKRPLVAGAFTTMLLSLAGIPLTAGFLGKFYVIAAGASQSRWVLLFTLVVSSTIGLFYYLRIIVAMYSQPEESRPRERVSHTAFVSPSYPGAGSSHRSHIPAGRLPRATLGCHRGCHSRSRVIYRAGLARIFALDVVLELFDCLILRESDPVHKVSD